MATSSFYASTGPTAEDKTALEGYKTLAAASADAAATSATDAATSAASAEAAARSTDVALSWADTAVEASITTRLAIEASTSTASTAAVAAVASSSTATTKASEAAASATIATTKASEASTSVSQLTALTIATGAAGTNASYNSATGVLTVPQGTQGLTGAKGDTGADATNTTEFYLNQFTGNGSTTAFTLSNSPPENLTNVFVSGVYQSKSNYSVSGTTLTFATAPPNGSAIEIMVAKSAPITSTYSAGTGLSLTGTTFSLTDKSNYDAAYGWGNHASAGYLTSYTDTNTTYTAGSGITLTGTAFSLTDKGNYDTAYGWGNHGSAGYLTAHQSLSSYAPLTSPTFQGTVTASNPIAATGGIYLGAVATSNKLEAYREGTWTPSVVGSNSGYVSTMTVTRASYTRVGNQITLSTHIENADLSGLFSGHVMITGIPFAPSADPGAVTVSDSTFFSFDETDTSIGGIVNGWGIILRKGSDTSPIPVSQFSSASNRTIKIHATYTIN
jgi:hypothetical protein